ncbi:hypothetical protein P3H80_29990 [Mycolicibacterium septicum]|uniref:hypothetical protein n=1 Tax=Mycolicibacterium septicum TaxID=98668 RepID=UPI0023E30CB0|nr:hypothetical protein [Mycolicibacterium septicum]MDF3341686.1 hypothetical protein [Mycolicibacterium septicum]
MVSLLPADALGSHASGVRDVLVDVVRSVHDRFAEAHLVSGSRYEMGFGSQWRDLLADSYDALSDCGFQSHKLLPAGYKLPVVNDCLLYVWRIPDSADPAGFASSPTKKNGFSATPPDPMLFEPNFGDESNAAEPSAEPNLERVVQAAGDAMPLVLIIVQSSPRQLQSIEWAVAELDESIGKVKLHGREMVWEPEVDADEAASEVESFDSGTPIVPAVELHEQEGMDPDAG